MRSVLSLATFAIGALCWFVTKQASSHRCSAWAGRVKVSQPGTVERGAR
jgi:hypothetical protein